MIRMPGNPEGHGAGIDRKVAINVLFVEGDELYRQTLASALSERGFVIQGFADSASLFQSLDATIGADVALLDWDAPRLSGIDMVAELRRHGVASPVVFLASTPRASDESLAFDRGARDFIDKARGVEVLVRRLRCAVAAANPGRPDKPEKSLMCGKLVLRLDIGRAYWNDMDVGLTFGEYTIVHLLVSNVGRYLSHREIYNHMHYDGFIAGNGGGGHQVNVRSAMKRIRQKFRNLEPAFIQIQNAHAVGYRWRAEDSAD